MVYLNKYRQPEQSKLRSSLGSSQLATFILALLVFQKKADFNNTLLLGD
jgi:hypothetical protein